MLATKVAKFYSRISTGENNDEFFELRITNKYLIINTLKTLKLQNNYLYPLIINFVLHFILFQ